MDLGVKIHGFPKNHQVYPGLPRRIHWKGVISVVREAVLSVPPGRPRRLIFSRRPRRPGDPRLSPLASEDIKNDDGQGPQLS